MVAKLGVRFFAADISKRRSIAKTRKQLVVKPIVKLAVYKGYVIVL